LTDTDRIVECLAEIVERLDKLEFHTHTIS
jgi:hypothetical protein